MDKKTVGLIGAVTALAAAGSAPVALAAPVSIDAAMTVRSYADLLKPIPNATVLLEASNAEEAAKAELLPPAVEGDATVQNAQYYHHHHHHHFGPRFGGPFFHHHHHGYYRRFYRHHHHHHHFRNYGY